MQWGFTENQTYIRLTNSNMSNNIDSLPLTREVDFAKQKTEGENTTPQSRWSRDSSPDKGSLFGSQLFDLFQFV